MPRVLIVDDDVDIRELIALRMGMDGHDVSPVGDPVVALSMASASGYDLAILDWTMPRMDGGELCARLRQQPGLGEAPILVVTAHADPEARTRALAAGASEYLPKPFTLSQLSDTVRELLATRRGART